MLSFTCFWVKKSLQNTGKLNLLVIFILLIAFTLFDTGIIYQDAQDNYYIQKNIAGTDILTGQVTSEFSEVFSYIEDSGIRHMEYHIGCSLVGIHERYQAIIPGSTGTVTDVFDDKGALYKALGNNQVILNADLREELEEFCTFEMREGQEWITIQKNGIEYSLQIMQTLSFENPYFNTDLFVMIISEQTLQSLCKVFDTPMKHTAFFNLKDITSNAVERFFVKMDTYFSGSSIRFTSIQNRTDIGYSTKLFQSEQNAMVLVMAAISVLFALITMICSVHLKVYKSRQDIATMKKLGISDVRIGFAVSTELFLLMCVAAVVAFGLSYFLMWLALDKINFILEHGKVGVNILFSWRLVVKILLSNTLAFIMVTASCWIKLMITTPVSYGQEKTYTPYVPRTSHVFLCSGTFSTAYFWLLIWRDKKNNLQRLSMNALPLINIILLMMVDMRGIAQETERIALYYTAMWDLAILMSWLRSIACIAASGILLSLYYESRAEEISTLVQIGIPVKEIRRAYLWRDLAMTGCGCVLAGLISGLYYWYVFSSVETHSLQIGYYFPIYGVMAYIFATVCVYAGSVVMVKSDI